MKKIRKILVTTDFSPLSAAGAEYARMLARTFRAQLCLAHVLEAPGSVGEPNIDLAYAGVWPAIEENAKKELRTFASRNLRGVRNVELRLLEGMAHDQIVRFAGDRGFDLIVMATHGRTGLAHLLIGSVAERVVRHSPVPVFLVKPEKMRRAIPRRRIRK